MAVLWITAINNSHKMVHPYVDPLKAALDPTGVAAWEKESAQHTYYMWTDATGAESHQGKVKGGKDWGTDQVEIGPGTNWTDVEDCAVPWSSSRNYRYLKGPKGTVRMTTGQSGSGSGEDVLMVFDNNTGLMLSDSFVIGKTGSGSMDVGLAITDAGVTFQYLGSSDNLPGIVNTFETGITLLTPIITAAIAAEAGS
jgi:hypothetical protein